MNDRQIAAFFVVLVLATILIAFVAGGEVAIVFLLVVGLIGGLASAVIAP